jgi:hypothetical protein
MLGEKLIWQLSKTAFFCAEKFSAGCVLKSYDWAAEMYNGPQKLDSVLSSV